MEIGLPEKNVNTVAPLLTMACVYEHRPYQEYEAIMREWAEWIMHDMKRTKEEGLQHCHAAVSYTHLDVYKRQVMIRTEGVLVWTGETEDGRDGLGTR